MLASGSLSCQSRRQSGSPAAGNAGAAAPPTLKVVARGPLRESDTGGLAVVLLHGWGATGDDLVSLADVLGAPGMRFYFPEAPLAERGGGRAWWHLDEYRAALNFEEEPPPGRPPHPPVLAARQAVQALLRQIKERQRPDRVVLGGFSQGAMLSLDVALTASPAVDAVVALSGLLLPDSLAALRSAETPRFPVFLSHGQHDAVLPFGAGQRAHTLLAGQGHQVTWQPFPGEHEIPPPVLRGAAAFLSRFAPGG